MNEQHLCQMLHDKLQNLTRYSDGFEPKSIPKNGLYFLFENGEFAHNGERIVRVGTHTGQNNLPKRICEHLYTENKDRSVFRKHIGRSILAKNNDAFLDVWNFDLTTKKDRAEKSKFVDAEKMIETESLVSHYIKQNLSFCVLQVDKKEDRLSVETALLSLLVRCPVCMASKGWLGLHHPNKKISQSGLWNIQGTRGIPADETVLKSLFS